MGEQGEIGKKCVHYRVISNVEIQRIHFAAGKCSFHKQKEKKKIHKKVVTYESIHKKVVEARRSQETFAIESNFSSATGQDRG